MSVDGGTEAVRKKQPRRTGREITIGVIMLLVVAAVVAAVIALNTKHPSSGLGSSIAGSEPSTTSTSASGASPVGDQPLVDTNPACGGTLAFEPAQIVLVCDGTQWVSHVIWSAWDVTVLGSSAREAVGTGTFNWDDCDPNCAQGKATTYAVNVTLSNIVSYNSSSIWGTMELDSSDYDQLPGSLASPPVQGGVSTLLFNIVP